jgi:SH3-like domain-containing protein
LARRFYEKAVDIRPEYLYCEALARLDGKAGYGAEFIRFLSPCEYRCDYGYAFARAGLWNDAENRFASAYGDYPTAVNALNRAVACEVLDRRTDAARYLKWASSLSGTEPYDSFSAYLSKAPDFPLSMRAALPALTTATDRTPLTKMIVTDHRIAMRLNPEYSAPVLSILQPGDIVDILSDDSAWFAVRIKNGKEGYLPAIFLGEPHGDGVTESTYSVPYELATPEEEIAENEPEGETEAEIEGETEPEPETRPVTTVQVRKDGNPVAVREEMSLLADITGYVEPGRKIKVKQTEDGRWLEIVSGSTQGYILKSYMESNSDDTRSRPESETKSDTQ